MGYLEKPHTSAGRMPSDKGYRAYVDDMLSVPSVSPKDEAEAREYLSDHLNEARQLIERATEYLSGKTDYLSVALSPQYADSNLEQIKIMMIEPGRAIVVLVLSAGIVHDRLIRIPAMIDEAQLDQIAQAIERRLTGKRLDDITLVTVSSAAEGTGLPEALVNQVLFEAYVAIKQTEKIEIYMDGKHRLLKHPEFHDIDRANRFYTTVQEDHMVAGYMMDMQQQEEQRHMTDGEMPTYMVRIGQEIALEGLEDMSFITTTYRVGDHIAGQIGVIGPKRMQYGEIISQVSFVNKALSDAANQHYGRVEPSDEQRSRDEQEEP
jgi:heat-inducible transcriptional repressor